MLILHHHTSVALSLIIIHHVLTVSQRNDIYRELILRVLPKITPMIQLQDPELFKHMKEEIMALKITNPEVPAKDYIQFKVCVCVCMFGELCVPVQQRVQVVAVSNTHVWCGII